jgi:hypothetical protein
MKSEPLVKTIELPRKLARHRASSRAVQPRRRPAIILLPPRPRAVVIPVTFSEEGSMELPIACVN